MTVTIVVPVFNGELHLADALTSIARQTLLPDQVLVIDDGSTDTSAAVARHHDLPAHYVYQENAGPAAARNRGLGLATGDLVAFLDADDAWPTTTLERLVGLLAHHPKVAIAQGLIQQMHLNSGRFEPRFRPYQYVNIGSALFRRSVFDQVGPFDPTLRSNEDTDWFFKSWEQGVEKVVVAEVVLFYRLHRGNMTRQQTLVHGGIVGLLHRHRQRVLTGGGSTAQPLTGRSDLTSYLGTPPPPCP